MGSAGYVLVGGRSSRMGRNKALLPYEGITLAAHVARQVSVAAGSVTLVGPPEIYDSLELPVIPDVFPGCGPLAGIHAALSHTSAEWNLVVACDMPSVDSRFLSVLLEKAKDEEADCLLPLSPEGRLEPLCAVYRRSCLPAITHALEAGIRKTTDGLAGLRLHRWQRTEALPFANMNTPEDWARHLESFRGAGNHSAAKDNTRA